MKFKRVEGLKGYCLCRHCRINGLKKRVARVVRRQSSKVIEQELEQ